MSKGLSEAPQQQKRSPIRWTRGKSDGRMIIRIPTWELRKAGEVLVRAQEDRKTGLWFWYGLGRNTASDMRDLAVVKAEAEAFARAALASPVKGE